MKREKRKEKLKHKKDLAANKKWEQFDRVFESISIKKRFFKVAKELEGKSNITTLSIFSYRVI